MATCRKSLSCVILRNEEAINPPRDIFYDLLAVRSPERHFLHTLLAKHVKLRNHRHIALDYLQLATYLSLQNAVGKMRPLALVLASYFYLLRVVYCQELSVIRHTDGDIFTIEGKYII